VPGESTEPGWSESLIYTGIHRTWWKKLMGANMISIITALLVLSLATNTFNCIWYAVFLVRWRTWGTFLMWSWSVYGALTSSLFLFVSETTMRGTPTMTGPATRLAIVLLLVVTSSLQAVAMVVRYREYVRER
jgi:hypothetical protein